MLKIHKLPKIRKSSMLGGCLGWREGEERVVGKWKLA